MTWKVADQRPHTVLVTEEDFEGFVVPALETYEAHIYRLGLGDQGEKDWDFRSRADSTREGIKRMLAENWRRPVFRHRMFYGKLDQTCKIVVEVIGGVELEPK